ncbi:MAG: ATP-dependent Clp protease adaptor ClpS [Treponema sp.]|jgi:ATP-dependent Clp protease adaptor protein ClpS|nr:ATP-dependent Clp protease adaptor ClpS [Treponema sp.]
MPQHTGGIKFTTRKKEKLKEPEEFRVILLNDNYTTMDFVVQVLTAVFHKNQEEAEQIMLDVHQKGLAAVGQYSWDIAQTKVNQVHALARQHEFPLRCIIEPI